MGATKKMCRFWSWFSIHQNLFQKCPNYFILNFIRKKFHIFAKFFNKIMSIAKKKEKKFIIGDPNLG